MVAESSDNDPLNLDLDAFRVPIHDQVLGIWENETQWHRLKTGKKWLA
jgi:hypothetical protein